MAQSIPSWAVRGAKVVCLFSPTLRDAAYDRKCRNIVSGEIYTIRAVASLGNDVGLWLEEIVNPTGDPGIGLAGETGFNILHFRPLVTRTAEQDVAMFAHHLNDVPVEA